MPSLDFKGKAFVYAHHLTVPFRELVPDAKKSCLPKSTAPALDGNLIVHGDNLHALKALLPLYAGKVDCVFIDPPYNTGNEGWCYNDNVRSPVAKEWLKKASPVDREDLERHDKWACMMWPRLKLLHELLAEDGVIFISIDDNEVHRLRALMDEIFGEENFVTQIEWQKRYTRSNNTDGFTTMLDDGPKNKALLETVPNLDRVTMDEDDFRGDQVIVRQSLNNVFRLLRPLVVMDEGHKAYGKASFDFLTGFNPSFILELSATPNGGKERLSNVVVNVTGTALQQEEMIKLPIRLINDEGADWKYTLEAAVAKLDELQKAAWRNRPAHSAHPTRESRAHRQGPARQDDDPRRRCTRIPRRQTRRQAGGDSREVVGDRRNW